MKKIFLLILLSALITSCESTSVEKTDQKSTIIINDNFKSGEDRFVLTHLLDKELEKPAYFHVEGTKWELDYSNGDKLFYSIISGNKETPLCGINALDNYDENCEICIKKEGEKATVEFKYANGILKYSGSYDK